MKRCQNREFLSIFLTKEGLNKYIKRLCKKNCEMNNKTRSRRAMFGKKVFLK